LIHAAWSTVIWSEVAMVLALAAYGFHYGLAGRIQK
jgi:hypothetical protein